MVNTETIFKIPCLAFNTDATPTLDGLFLATWLFPKPICRIPNVAPTGLEMFDPFGVTTIYGGYRVLLAEPPCLFEQRLQR